MNRKSFVIFFPSMWVSTGGITRQMDVPPSHTLSMKKMTLPRKMRIYSLVV
jgi:hypothetical protein